MTQDLMASDQAKLWDSIAHAGIVNAIHGLSVLVNADIEPTSIKMDRVPLVSAVEFLGGLDAVVAGVYLSIMGDAEGHIVLIYEPKIAFSLIDAAMGDPDGTTTEFGEMEQSVLSEVGNIMGGNFLTTVADITNMNLQVTPPTFMLDMAGSILDGVIAQLMMTQDIDETVVLRAAFQAGERHIEGDFIVLPSPEILAHLASK